MKFKLLIVEDADFWDNMKGFLEDEIEVLHDNSSIKLSFDRAENLERVTKYINQYYYIGTSLDQNIPDSKNKNIVSNEYGVKVKDNIKISNILSFQVILSNYPFDIKFSGYVKDEAYFHKYSDDLEDWAKYLVENSIKYIT